MDDIAGGVLLTPGGQLSKPEATRWCGRKPRWSRALLSYPPAGSSRSHKRPEEGVARGQRQRPSGLPIQTVGMLVFGSTVLVALFYVDMDLGGKLVAIAILGHAGWDAYHLLRNRVVSRSYAEFCAVFDLLLGAAILFMT